MRAQKLQKCEKCFHFHPNAEECFKHNIPRHPSDWCNESGKLKQRK